MLSSSPYYIQVSAQRKSQARLSETDQLQSIANGARHYPAISSRQDPRILSIHDPPPIRRDHCMPTPTTSRQHPAAHDSKRSLDEPGSRPQRRSPELANSDGKCKQAKQSIQVSRVATKSSQQERLREASGTEMRHCRGTCYLVRHIALHSHLTRGPTRTRQKRRITKHRKRYPPQPSTTQ